MGPLENLASAWFNPDFDLDFEDADGVVLGFAEAEAPARVRGLIGELQALGNSSLSETQLDQLWTGEWGSSYEPAVDDMTYREWFSHVGSLLESWLTDRETAEG